MRWRRLTVRPYVHVERSQISRSGRLDEIEAREVLDAGRRPLLLHPDGFGDVPIRVDLVHPLLPAAAHVSDGPERVEGPPPDDEVQELGFVRGHLPDHLDE